MNHFKLKVKNTYKKDEKITTKFETGYVDDVKKTHLETKLSKTEVQIPYIEKKQ